MRKAGDGNVSWRVSVWAEPRPQSTCHYTTREEEKHHFGFRLYSVWMLISQVSWICIKHNVSTEFRLKGLPQQGRSNDNYNPNDVNIHTDQP